jgi:hypothetical protein
MLQLIKKLLHLTKKLQNNQRIKKIVSLDRGTIFFNFDKRIYLNHSDFLISGEPEKVDLNS